MQQPDVQANQFLSNQGEFSLYEEIRFEAHLTRLDKAIKNKDSIIMTRIWYPLSVKISGVSVGEIV